MTEQYLQRNINNPPGSRSIDTDTQLESVTDGEIVIVDATGGAVVVQLPPAQGVGGGATITIVRLGPLGINTVTVSTATGDTLLVPAGQPIGNVLGTDGGARIFRTDGDSNWSVTGGLN